MISWTSQETHVLLNPRLSLEENQRLSTLALESASLPGHVWLSTSGSTGKSQMVALSKDALLVSARAVNRHLSASSMDRWCCPLPSFHVGGLSIYARAFLLQLPVLTLEPWNPDDFLGLCRKEKITLTSLVPAQVSDLIQAGHHAPAPLRAVVVGGGELGGELYRKARVLGWPLLPSYGMTECASQIATGGASTLQVGAGVRPQDLSRDGPPELKLLDHLDARLTSDGRLSFRGESLLTGYAVEREGSPHFVDPKIDGWFDSDDRGVIKPIGEGMTIEVMGRERDFLKIGGESVSMARLGGILDALLRSWDGEIDGALAAVPDERMGHVIHLVVAGGEEAARELRSAFDQRVLPFERVRGLHAVDAISRSVLGKVLHGELQAQIGMKIRGQDGSES